MDIPKVKHEPSLEQICRFNNKGLTSVGKIKLYVQVGIPPIIKASKTLFVVMDQPSYYDVFLTTNGR